jgi:hypothetical protein
MDSSADNSVDHPIYKALNAIGTKEKSIQPSALVRYGQLLACKEVQRRAGPDADDPTLARHARQTLLDMVAQVDDRTDKLVAQAALCTTDAFKGLRINERLHILPSRITEDVFKVRRRELFKGFVRQLTQGALPTVAVQTYDETKRRSLPVLHRLAEIAATLQYACLAPLFVSSFDAKLDAQEVTYARPSKSGAGPHVFCSLATFMLEYDRSLNSAYHQRVLTYLPPKSLDTVTRFAHGIIEQGPAFSEQQRDRLELVLSHEPLKIDLSPVNLAVGVMESASWRSWYFETGESIAISKLEAIAAKSGAVAEAIMGYIGGADVTVSKAQRDAYAAVRSSYYIREIISDDQSFEDEVATYFTAVMSRLQIII